MLVNCNSPSWASPLGTEYSLPPFAFHVLFSQFSSQTLSQKFRLHLLDTLYIFNLLLRYFFFYISQSLIFFCLKKKNCENWARSVRRPRRPYVTVCLTVTLTERPKWRHIGNLPKRRKKNNWYWARQFFISIHFSFSLSLSPQCVLCAGGSGSWSFVLDSLGFRENRFLSISTRNWNDVWTPK